jgi:hypothetical protein
MLPDYTAIKLCALYLIGLLAPAQGCERPGVSFFLRFYDGVASLVRLP